MADDKSSLSTDKPVAESSSASSSVRSSSGGRGGGLSGFGNRQGQGQRRQDSREEQSSETSVSLGNSSPAKTAKGPSNNRGDRKPIYSGRDNREGRQRRGGGGGGTGGGRDRDQGQRHSTSETISGEGVTSTGQQELSGTGTSSSKKDNKKKYTVRKRAPPKEDFEIKPNDVFVNERSNFGAQLSKCKKLFEKGNREVYLHGLGKAIPRAINIAFELKKFYHNTVDYTVNTSTVKLFDDIIDLEDPDQPPSVRTRNVSSVDIKVYRSLNIP